MLGVPLFSQFITSTLLSNYFCFVQKSSGSKMYNKNFIIFTKLKILNQKDTEYFYFIEILAQKA